MKLTLIFLLFVSCCFSQIAKESVNVTDSAGKKQGKWILTGKMKPQLTAFLPNQIIEEGYYKDNRKTGIWKEYYANGVQKNELNFANGRPDGKAIMYHDNSCKAEEGLWKNNRWTNLYTAYDRNENIIEQIDFSNSNEKKIPANQRIELKQN